jgi:hypothetical protein
VTVTDLTVATLCTWSNLSPEQQGHYAQTAQSYGQGRFHTLTLKFKFERDSLALDLAACRIIDSLDPTYCSPAERSEAQSAKGQTLQALDMLAELLVCVVDHRRHEQGKAVS